MNAGTNPDVHALAISVAPDEVRRFLGYDAAARPSARLAERLDELWGEAVALAEPRGAWRVIDRAAAAAAGMLDAGPQVGLGACTIGSALEERSARDLAAGALLDALILDAVGSAAAEAAADELNRLLCGEAAARGLFAAPRQSPGYGDWDVACQPRLLALLPAAGLGIALTSGGMMVPRKSVTFAVSFAAGPPPAGADAPCARCGLQHCRHRARRAGAP